MLNSEDIHKRFLDALTEAGKKKPNSNLYGADTTQYSFKIDVEKAKIRNNRTLLSKP